MIWNDTIADIVAAINGQSVFNASRSTTPSDLGLKVFNQTQDWLCMYKPWRDLRVTVQLTPDTAKKITMPADYGCCLFVYTDPAGIGKPMYFYTLNDNNVAMRYTEEASQDAVTGTRILKFVFPATTFLPANPYVVYSKAIPSAVLADLSPVTVDGNTFYKKSFFPINIVLITAKKLFQDWYGQSANQDPNWIEKRFAEEMRIFEGYAYNNNVALDMAVKDRFGSPVFIPGTSLDGSRSRVNRPSPYVPATLWTGGTM
jgi:hypothetical protein